MTTGAAPRPTATPCQVSRVRRDGEQITSSGRMPRLVSQAPAAVASAWPRGVRGRSMSATPGGLSALACRRMARVRMVTPIIVHRPGTLPGRRAVSVWSRNPRPGRGKSGVQGEVDGYVVTDRRDERARVEELVVAEHGGP